MIWQDWLGFVRQGEPWSGVSWLGAAWPGWCVVVSSGSEGFGLDRLGRQGKSRYVVVSTGLDWQAKAGYVKK